MNHRERAHELHHRLDRHYNCAQATLIPFVEELGLDHETCYALAAQFGSGMRRGAVCGAVTGGLMALGLLGADDQAARTFQKRFQERAGAMDCVDLLRAAAESGEAKKPHCDRMVQIAVELVEELAPQQRP